MSKIDSSKLVAMVLRGDVEVLARQAWEASDKIRCGYRRELRRVFRELDSIIWITQEGECERLHVCGVGSCLIPNFLEKWDS